MKLGRRFIIEGMKIPLKLRTLFLSFLLPFLYILGVIFFDLQESIRTVTPSLCTIGLLIMALYVRPSLMIWWSCIYSVVVVLSLTSPRINELLSNGYIPPEFTSHWFRSAGFVSTAFFCCIFSILLNNVRIKKKQLHHLIQNLPVPVLVSDQEGKLLMINHKACLFLDIKSEEKNNSDFFDLLAPLAGHGRCIATYMSAFSKQYTQPSEIELEFRGNPVLGKIVLMEGSPKKLVMVLSQKA